LQSHAGQVCPGGRVLAPEQGLGGQQNHPETELPAAVRPELEHLALDDQDDLETPRGLERRRMPAFWVGYPNFESFQRSRDLLNGPGFTRNIIKNGTELALDQINYCFQPSNIQIFQIQTDDAPESFVLQSPYLFYEVEHKSVGDSLGLEKILRILSPLELVNELSFDLDVFFSSGLFSSRAPSSSRIPIPFDLRASNCICYSQARAELGQESGSGGHAEYYKLKINEVLWRIMQENENPGKYRFKERRRRRVYLMQKGECGGVGFHITIEGTLPVFGQREGLQFQKYLIKFKPFLTLVSTLPLKLDYRLLICADNNTNTGVGTDTGIDNNIGRLGDLCSGKLEYMRPRSLYLPSSLFEADPRVRLEIGVGSRREDGGASGFSVIWSCLIDLGGDFRLGVWRSQSSVAAGPAGGDQLQDSPSSQLIGEMVPGKSSSSMFSVYNLERSPGAGYPLAWVIHSKHWFSSVGSDLGSSHVVRAELVRPVRRLDQALRRDQAQERGLHGTDKRQAAQTGLEPVPGVRGLQRDGAPRQDWPGRLQLCVQGHPAGGRAPREQGQSPGRTPAPIPEDDGGEQLRESSPSRRAPQDTPASFWTRTDLGSFF
ncbi:hypothetical protein OIY81_3325, partial [Cryptosporidium canis]